MLRDECKPPLLQNGDGLKPGDWIMVRSKECEEWRKRRFMCFRRGMFITSDSSTCTLNFNPDMWIPANVKTID